MSIYFSGVDDGELSENSVHYNYYVSLITGFNMQLKAKIAIPVKTVIPETDVVKTVTYTDENGETVVKTEDVVYAEKNTFEINVIECDVEMETSSHVLEQYSKLKEEIKTIAPSTNKSAFNSKATNKIKLPEIKGKFAKGMTFINQSNLIRSLLDDYLPVNKESKSEYLVMTTFLNNASQTIFDLAVDGMFTDVEEKIKELYPKEKDLTAIDMGEVCIVMYEYLKTSIKEPRKEELALAAQEYYDIYTEQKQEEDLEDVPFDCVDYMYYSSVQTTLVGDYDEMELLGVFAKAYSLNNKEDASDIFKRWNSVPVEKLKPFIETKLNSLDKDLEVYFKTQHNKVVSLKDDTDEVFCFMYSVMEVLSRKRENLILTLPKNEVVRDALYEKLDSMITEEARNEFENIEDIEIEI